jgi:hypothetical protein
VANPSRQAKPKIRYRYGPWTDGMDMVADPALLSDKALAYVENLNFSKEGSLYPRGPIRTIARTTVTGLASAPYKVLGFDNYGSLGVAILAKTTYNGTPAETGTTFTLVNGAESTTKTYASQIITGQIAPITSTDQGYYKYLWYDTKGYFLSVTSGKSFSATNLTNTATKAYLPNVPINGTDAFMFKDRMWIIAGKRVYYSKATDPSIWAAPDGGFFDILSEDEHDPITAFAVVRDTIFFFKRNSAYQFNYSSDPGADGYLRTVSKVMGAVNAVVYNGLVFILDVRGVYQFVNDQFICITDRVTMPGIPNKFYRLMIYNDKLFCLLNPLTFPRFLVLDFNTGYWSYYTQGSSPYNGTFDFTWVAINPLVDTEGADALVWANGNQVFTYSENSQIVNDVYMDSSVSRTVSKPWFEVHTKNFTLEDTFNYKHLHRIKFAGSVDQDANISAIAVTNEQLSDPMQTFNCTVSKGIMIHKPFKFRDFYLKLVWPAAGPISDTTYTVDQLQPASNLNYNRLPYLRGMELEVTVDESYGGDAL